MEHFSSGRGDGNRRTEWGAPMVRALDRQVVPATLHFGEGGETGPVDEPLRATVECTGARGGRWA
jgi:hypothetical protein